MAGAVRTLMGLAVAALLTASSPRTVPAASGEANPLSLLPAYQVTEHAPIIKGRYDEAYRRALESAFRKALMSALGEIDPAAGSTGDFGAWQNLIFSRASDFVASYQVLDQDAKEGYLSLSILARVDREKLRRAVETSSAASALVPLRVLVLVDNFPLAGSGGGEDIDAGHVAAGALEAALLREGLIIVPAPETLPWQDTQGQASSENRRSLAAAAGTRIGADYVVLGDLAARASRLLVLSAELVAVSSEKTVAVSQSPVEIQSNTPPRENFVDPAGEIARAFARRLPVRKGSPSPRSPAP